MATDSSISRLFCLGFVLSSLLIHRQVSAIYNNNWNDSPASKLKQPEFSDPIANATVFLGREIALTCSVKDLGTFRVAWLKEDSDIATLLTVHSAVIANDARLRVSHHNNQKWTLHIKDVMESDAGSYMCQINSEPMMSQTGFLDVLVPPTIIEEETSSDVVVEERSKVSLRCKANGYPTPTVIWRREDSKDLNLGNFAGKKISEKKVEGEYLNISQVSRDDMGAYLCIITNQVPPSVSKRISVQVNFKPKIKVPNQLIGGSKESTAVIECRVEASPKPLTSWIRHDQTILFPNQKYVIREEVQGYRIKMRLEINDVTDKDFGSYKCVAKNTLGEKEGFLRLYETEFKKKDVPDEQRSRNHRNNNDPFTTKGDENDAQKRNHHIIHSNSGSNPQGSSSSNFDSSFYPRDPGNLTSHFTRNINHNNNHNNNHHHDRNKGQHWRPNPWMDTINPPIQQQGSSDSPPQVPGLVNGLLIGVGYLLGGTSG